MVSIIKQEIEAIGSFIRGNSREILVVSLATLFLTLAQYHPFQPSWLKLSPLLRNSTRTGDYYYAQKSTGFWPQTRKISYLGFPCSINNGHRASNTLYRVSKCCPEGVLYKRTAQPVHLLFADHRESLFLGIHAPWISPVRVKG